MRKKVLKLLTSYGTLVSPDAIKYILEQDQPEKYVQEILKQLAEAPLYLTLEILQIAEAGLRAGKGNWEGVNNGELNSLQSSDQALSKELTPKTPQTPKTHQNPSAPTQTNQPKETTEIQVNPPSKKPLASDYIGEVTIFKDVTGQSTTEGTLNDFIKYFQERFKMLRKILQNQRREARGISEIARLRGRTGPLKFIGLINSVRTTKQGHKIIELEDETDTISALINNTSPLINLNFVDDEIICVIGKLGKSDLVYVEDIIQPDVPIARNPHRSEDPLSCLFMGDIHNGSTTFLHKSWDKLIKWLNGKYTLDKAEQLRDRLKYIVIAGDIVDGIGVYPDQESELDIIDIYAQYEDLAVKFQEIPDHLKLIMLPGNHDAVRPAEPQPTFPDEITKLFSNDIIFVGNPCYFSINTIEILAYHGRSMDDFVMKLPEMNYNQPTKIMKEMLIRRHLAPMYGQKTPLAPENQDYMAIERIPDFFVTGHVHKTAAESYRDISLINASAWQAQTSYQKMRNFNPDPAKVILADLQTQRIQLVDFN